MFVLALIAIVGAAPIPAVFIFFAGLKEELADDIGSASFDDFSLFLSDHFIELIFGQFAKIFASDGVHDELGPLIDI